ncbi:MAG: class I SAM-dependent methyltransferase [Hyphomicrobiaceae bacterium]|nr:class I SAM-dependent methyltransferase [Hyphomicrobiaceae bacterium]
MSQPDRSAAEAMDRMYRHQRHIYDLTRRLFLFGRDRVLARLQPPSGGSVLEIGCGTARNLVRAARLYPRATFYGIDVSREMLATARASVERAGLADRIRLAEADAASFEPGPSLGRDGFDRVLLSFALSMMPPWRAALAHAVACVAPGGELHIVDFGQLEGFPPSARRLLFAWLGRFGVVPEPQLAAELQRLADAGRLSLEYEQLYRGYVHAATLRR